MSDAASLKTVLVALDLTAASDRLVGRVAELPLAARATVVLLHVVPGGLSARDRTLAKADARARLQAEVRALAGRLPPGTRITRRVAVGSPAAKICEAAASAGAQLVVTGRGSETVSDVFLGSTAERVTRQSALPVLVVRLRPRGPYSRPALALELDDAARGATAALLDVLAPPRGAVLVVHACDVPYVGRVYPRLESGQAIAYVEREQRRAGSRLAKLLGAVMASRSVPPAETPAWRPVLADGPARTAILETARRERVDLLVLGTRGSSLLGRALLGTVAGDVLRAATCDVLVVPPRRTR
ncbi:MAG: universal stress protein [Myxococcaceae bacterium]|nr:universal stress protein [Myxococcaceae bacterium]